MRRMGKPSAWKRWKSKFFMELASPILIYSLRTSTDLEMTDQSTTPRIAGAASQKQTQEPLFERILSLWKTPSIDPEHSTEEEDFDDALPQDIAAHERRLISNVEALRDLTVDDVM